MLKHFIYLFLLFNWSNIKAQNYFSKTDSVGDIQYVLGNDFKILNDSIVVYSATIKNNDTINYINYWLLNLKSGIKIKEKKYSYPKKTIQNFIGYSLVCSSYENAIYHCARSIDLKTEIVQMQITKLDYNLDTIFVVYTQSGLANEGSAIIEGRDSCLYITGRHYSAKHIDSTSILLAKFRPDGTNVWEKFYDIPDTAEQGYNIVQDKQGSIYIGQSKTYFYNKVGTKVQIPIILKVDEKGDIIFRKLLGSPVEDQCGSVLNISTNNTLYSVGCRNSYHFVLNTDSAGQFVIKGNIEYFNYDTSSSIYINTMRQTESGDYIIAGTVNIVQIKYPNGKYGYMSLAGYIAKMSGSSGKMLWERMYTTRWKDWAQNYIVAMDLMPNGNIVTLGSALSLTDTGRNDMDQWLMYLDSNGCLSPTDCGAEWMRYRAPLSLQDGNVELVVYPIPFDTHLDLRCTSYSSQSMQLKVVHAGGAVLYNAPFDPSLPLHIDTDQWPKGLYILSVTDDSRMIQSYKLWK